MKANQQLIRIERKIDLVLFLQGVTIAEIEELSQTDPDALQALTAKLKKSADALKAVTAANKPK